MLRRAATVPILTWHAIDVAGADHASNDHVAFREDLELIDRLGLRVVPLRSIVDALVERRLGSLEGCVGLSFDDGADFDFHDVPHPTWGPQRGMSNILEDFRARHATTQPSLHATSFTIVSPAARRELDGTSLVGCRWWNDDWYASAERRGTIAVESHSWDHNDATLGTSATRAARGGFMIENEAEAQAEIGEAARMLRTLRKRDGDVLFAYPYGEVSEYLARDWFPKNGERLGIPAAFSANDDDPVDASASRWSMPRYTARFHWKSTDELERVLREARAIPRRSGVARLFAPRPAAISPTVAPKPSSHWRDYFRTWEVNDAKVLAGELFKKSFAQEIPDMAHHYVLVYSPPAGSDDAQPSVVAYVHQLPKRGFHLCGGMCVDERAYRTFPKWLFQQVRDAGGLATIVTSDSMTMLGDSPASFGYVGDAKARAADLRTGFIDTGIDLLMVKWLKPLDEGDKQRMVAEAAELMPF